MKKELTPNEVVFHFDNNIEDKNVESRNIPINNSINKKIQHKNILFPFSIHPCDSFTFASFHFLIYST